MEDLPEADEHVMAQLEEAADRLAEILAEGDLLQPTYHWGE